MDDLLKILPETKTVEAGGESFTLRPFGIGKAREVMPLVHQLLDHVTVQEDDLVHVDMLAVMTDGLEPMLALNALATGKPRAWFDELDMDQGLTLSAAVITTNIGFFAKAVLLERQAARRGKVPIPGEISLPSSSAPGTDTKTS